MSRTSETPAAWSYEVDEKPKRKHHWDQAEPGFVEVGGVRIGKCPGHLAPGPATQSLLERLLAEGVPWYPKRWHHPYPKRIYIVHESWLYRATPTNAGRSYHAFPEDWQDRKVPRELHEPIRALARREGCAAEIEKWLS